MEEKVVELLRALRDSDCEHDIEEPQNKNILFLAYIGDVIYDLFTRDLLLRRHIDKVKRDELHRLNSDLVCAKAQTRIIEELIDRNVLSESEIDFYRHARNAHSNSKSKNSSIVEYRKATGFEALLGLLFYKHELNRLMEIFNKIKELI